ncbi:MAG TPA: TetR/AcrR family transcriptional regulator [Chthoniobacterales bacterium]|nr:TetR/AcrR family transcriptional regulator [Chthoniobacterales bacterium]
MPDEKRQRIVSAALAVFFKYGYQRVSMNEIAEAAGISRPGLYLYFSSKEEVFRAAILQFADSLIEEISKGLPAQKTIGEKVRYAFEVWIVQRFDVTLNSPEAKEISDSSYEFAQEALDQSYEKLESVLASILKGHVKSSGNKKMLSAEKMAHILTSAVRGFKLVAKSATELRKLIRDLVVIILTA